MTVLEMFERVNLKSPLAQRRFFNCLNDTIIELSGLYGDVPKLLLLQDDNGEVADSEDIKTLSDHISILPLYHEAIVDNILFLNGNGDSYKGEFIRKSENAYLKYWNENAKGRRIKQS